jgi:hypothetical protein
VAARTRGDDFILLDGGKEEVRAGYIEGAVTFPRLSGIQAAAHLPQTDTDVWLL